MQDSVIKYDGKRGVSWTFVIDVGRDAKGKRIQKWRRGFPTKKAAEAAMRLELHERQSGTYIEKNPETVGELLDRWLQTVARHKVKPTTLEDYTLTVSKHLKPALGHIQVQALTAATVQRFYSDRLDAGIGARSVQLCHQRLSQALGLAEREAIVSRNVCRATEPPKAPPKQGRSWTAEEARRFLATAEADTYWPLWLLALKTGLRRGELLGIRWKRPRPRQGDAPSPPNRHTVARHAHHPDTQDGIFAPRRETFGGCRRRARQVPGGLGGTTARIVALDRHRSRVLHARWQSPQPE
jgi:integrase